MDVSRDAKGLNRGDGRPVRVCRDMTGGGGGTPLKSTTGQYVVRTRITACYVCAYVRAYTIVPCWIRNEKKKKKSIIYIYIYCGAKLSLNNVTLCMCVCVCVRAYKCIFPAFKFSLRAIGE